MSKQNITSIDLSKQYILNGLSAMPGGFFIYRAVGNEEIIYANHALLKMFECDTEEEFKELTGNTFKGIVFPQDLELVENSIHSQISGQNQLFDQVHYRIQTKTGKIRVVEDYGRFFEDPVEGPLFYVFVSIAHVRLDTLTGLPNTWYFMELAGDGEKRWYHEGKNSVILAFDLCGMKGFNSKYGHAEGDVLLCAFADILRIHFGNENCARFGEDHFYAFAEEDGIEEELNELILHLHEANEGKTLNVKIGICAYDPNVPINIQCDRAKMACRKKINGFGSGYTWYDEKMSKNYMKQEYILSHIDQALSEGWIRVYYQPVIRTLTEKLCSMEALARWEDPEYGMIPPGDFIPILEDNGLSYKLDMYIVRRVAEYLQRKLRAGEAIVPISVNVSRSDFDACDPVTVVSSSADEHGIRRRFICVEITETSILGNKDVMRRAIERFHEAGIEVWMDDFGSGYSSLNVLKDFRFDEIKIDMEFLRDFSQRSKTIIKNAVQLAKEVGIHTLAEGVENVEQLEFLKSIGCEKIQGYYYGKPMPPVEAEQNLQNKCIDFETREGAAFFDQLGCVEFSTDIPQCFLIYNDNSFIRVYENECFKNFSDSLNFDDLYDLSNEGNVLSFVQKKKFVNLAEKAIKSDEVEMMTLVRGENVFFFSFKIVAKSRRGTMLRGCIEKSIFNNQKKALDMMDSAMRSIIATFDGIYIVDFEEDTRLVVSTILPFEKVGQVTHNISSSYKDYPKKYVYFEDVDEWIHFLTKENFEARMHNSGCGSFREIFRIKKPKEGYKWTEFTVILISESKNYGDKYLICVKPAEIEDEKDKKDKLCRVLRYYDLSIGERNADDGYRLWNSFLLESNIKLFWKDINRRFIGASRAFLDYYGFTSIDDIYGKTDEDIGWNLDDKTFLNDELRVIKNGDIIQNSAGQNIVDGVLRNIIAIKFPIYEESKIKGLMGYFVDIENDFGGRDMLKDSVTKDPMTGLMNSLGMQETIARLDDNLRISGEDYVYVVINVDDFRELKDDYGEQVAKDGICKVAEVLKTYFPANVTIARMYGSKFAVCSKELSIDSIDAILNQFAVEIATVKEINKHPYSLRVTIGIAHGAEANEFWDVIELAHNRMAKRRKNDFAINAKIAKANEMLDDLPVPCVIVKPMLDEMQEKCIDIIYVYANKKYCQMCNISIDEVIGKRYLECFPYTNDKWVDFAYRAAHGEYISDQLYGGSFGHWVDFVAAPSVVDGCSIFTMKIIDRQKEEKDKLTIGRKTDENIINILKILGSSEEYIESINMTLNEIGHKTGAERVGILETDRFTYSETFEWFKEGKDEISPKRQKKSYKEIAFFEKILTRNNSVLVNEVESLRTEHTVLYFCLKAIGTTHFIVVPLYDNEKIIGYIIAENYMINSEIDTVRFLETISFFLAARIINHKLYIKEVNTRKEKEYIAKNWMTDDSSIRIARILDGKEDYHIAMNHVLEEISKVIHPERLYIYETDQKTISRTFEWCAKGVKSQIDTMQKLDYKTYMGVWENNLSNSTSIVIDDIEKYKKSDNVLYNTLKRQGIKRIIDVPFYIDGELKGYIGADNYEINEIVDTKLLLETVSFFIGSRVANHYFKKLSKRDRHRHSKL